MKKNKVVTIQVRCSEGERDALDFLAAATGMNASAVVRTLIRIGTELATAEKVKLAAAGEENRPVELRIAASDSVDKFVLYLYSLYQELVRAGREDLAQDVVSTILGHWIDDRRGAEPLPDMPDALSLLREKGVNEDDKR